MRHIRYYLVLASLLLLGSLASPASAATTYYNLANAPSNKSVVLLAPTIVGGTITGSTSVEATEAVNLGYDVVINDAATWGGMTQANFASFRAIILGDPPPSGNPAPITAAVTNRATWSPVVTGNMIIIGTDPAVHRTGPSTGSSLNGGTELTQKGIAFVTADPTKTGIYIALSGYYVTLTTPTAMPLLDQFGVFLVKQAPASFNNAHLVATHPAFAGLMDSELSHWNQSVHEIFTQWPPNFQVFAIALNVGSVYTATDGTVGTPYILTRGAAVLSNVHLDPETAINPIGTTHTVTATISPAPPVGTPVTFKIVSGPNAGLGTLNPPVPTNAGGTASKTYTGTGGAGTDYIVASYTNIDGKVQTSNTVTKTWVTEDAASCAEFSATTACQGTATELTDLTAGATSWSWSFGDGATSTQQNPTHLYAAAGTYPVTLTTNGGACKVTHTVTVTAAPPAPTIVGPGSTCDKTATYCIQKTAGVNYSWSVTGGTMSSPTNTATQSCLTVTWNTTGNGLVTATATGAETCCKTIARLFVQSCEDYCCEEIKGSAVLKKDPVSLGGGAYSITPTLSATGNIVRVTATIVSTTQTFAPGTECGTSAPVNSYIKLPLYSPTGFTAALPMANGREEVWKSASGVNISGGLNFSINIQFPPLSSSGLTGACPDVIRFCVKYTFTDERCHTCEIIRCYEVVRGGGGVATKIEVREVG